ncbi:MAG: Gfo/Idh/MocA family oxidoreductase [Rubricoccaceae bacterium]
MKRRTFVRTAAAGAAAPMIVPRHVLGGVGFTAPSDTVVIGMVGAGGMGAGNASALVRRDDVRIGALADIDMGVVADAVRRRVESDNPDQQATGRALRDAYDNATAYADYREMLDRETGLDAVIVATPDHIHAHAALTAMGKGLHVYAQKPLAATVHECRRLAQAASSTGVVTQMGNQGHSSDDGRFVVDVLRAGVLGRIHEVQAWTDRPRGWWMQGVPASEPEPTPEGVNWDLYLGPNEDQPYRPGIHPFGWRGWVGFGTASLGDMGAHLVDFPVWALDLPRPSRVETRHTPWGGDQDDPDTYPLATVTHYHFDHAGHAAGAARANGPVTMTWYDGGMLPPTPLSAPDGFTLDPNGGILYIGERGMLVHETYGTNPRFLPLEPGGDASALEAAAAAVPATLPRIEGGIRGHEANWIRAIQGQEPISSPFSYAAHLTEIMLIGVAAMKAGRPIELTPEGTITNVPNGEALLTRTYRRGWTLPNG